MLSHTYFPSVGGGIRYKKAIVEHLRSKGHDVDVLALSNDGESSSDVESGGTIYRMKAEIRTPMSPVSFRYLLKYRQIASEYDVLLFNFPSPMEEVSEVIFSDKTRSTRKVVMYHADIVDAKPFSGFYNRLITRRFLDAMDAVIVSSPNIAESSRHLSRIPEKIHVIPFGIDLARYGCVRQAAVNTDVKSVRVLFVGRLSRYKGIDVLLRAFAALPADYGSLHIVGDGPLRDSMTSLAHQLTLGGRVRFLGSVPDDRLIQEYHEADVFVLPSVDAGEAFGYVLIEAMAGGNAIISTELGTGTSFVNVHGETGYVVMPNDVFALSAALREVIEEPELRQRMQVAAFERAKMVFEEDRMLKENEEVITAVAESVHD